jgi:phosphatidylserine/phosphatidylglycerophosphate/cardiolipin synthase-like enzyme
VERDENQEESRIGGLVKLLVQPQSGFEPLIQAIKRARRTIDLTIFRLDKKGVAEALAAAVQRGVKVRALVAHTNRGGEARLRRLEQQLLGLGLMVSRTAGDLVKYHGKFMIIDDTLHVLGFNYTKNDTARRSFAIQSRDRRAVRDALQLFESDVTKQPYAGAKTSPLVVSPETSRPALRQFLAGARKELAIYDGRLEDLELSKLLSEKAADGVTVRVLGKAPRLKDAANVRNLKPLKLHVRAIIRDGTRAFVGSQSLRPLELDRRREVGLIITNPSIARQMMTVFEEDWEASAPKKEDEKAKEKEVQKGQDAGAEREDRTDETPAVRASA